LRRRLDLVKQRNANHPFIADGCDFDARAGTIEGDERRNPLLREVRVEDRASRSVENIAKPKRYWLQAAEKTRIFDLRKREEQPVSFATSRGPARGRTGATRSGLLTISSSHSALVMVNIGFL
jgi:hypothetical protein